MTASTDSHETTPLLHQIFDQHELDVLQRNFDIGDDEEDDEEIAFTKELEGESPTWTLREICVTAVAIVAATLSICVMYTVPEDMYPLDLYLYDAFNVLGFMLPIYSSYQEQKVTEVKDVHKKMKQYEKQIKQLAMKNEQATNRLKSLQDAFSRLNGLKQVLEDVKEMEGEAINNIDDALIQEKQEILKENEVHLLTETIDNVVSVLLKGDSDQNMVLSDKETEKVIDTLEGIHAVKFNRELILQKIEEYGNNLEGIMRLINDMFDDDPSLESYLQQ